MKLHSLHNLSELFDVLLRAKRDPGDLRSTLQQIAQFAYTFFDADSCVIFAINPITSRFIQSLTAAGHFLYEDGVPYEEFASEELAKKVLKLGTLVVEDLDAMPEYQSTFTRSENIRSFVALALHIRQHSKPLGVLYLNFRQQQQFSPDDLALFQIFANQASFMLEETWLLRRYQEVTRIGQEINSELADGKALFQKLQKYIPDILDTTYAFLLAVYQPQTNTLDVYLEEEGYSALQFNRPLEGASQHVIETKQTLFIEYLSKTEHLPFQFTQIPTETGPKESLIFVPLEFRDVSLGVLSIQHPKPNAYNREDLSILQLLGTHIALALHNMDLYNSLDQLNKFGQLLTQQLDSEEALQATVDKIWDATKSDIVILYPYESSSQRFVLPPIIAGTLKEPDIQSIFPSRVDDSVALMLQHKEPIFARNSASFYMKLHGEVDIQPGSFGPREKVRSIVAVPLRVGDELVGVLFVNFRQPQRFDATQKLFIEGLAHYAAIAVKNVRIFGSLSQRRIRELEILQKIDRELSRNLDLEDVLGTLLKLANEQVHAEGASILLYDARIQVLETAAAVGRRRQAEEVQKLIIPLQETKGITRWAMEEKKAARVDNVHLDPKWRDLYIETAPDTVAELDVPLLDGEEVVGVLNLESTREGAFRQEDEDFMITLAGQAVLAVKKAQAYEREKRFAAEGQVLNQISKEIISQLNHVHVFDLILEKALELTDSHMGNLMLYDPVQNDLWMAAERGATEDKKDLRQTLDQGIVGYAARNKQLLNVDLSRAQWKEMYLEFFPGVHSELAVPMLVGDEIRGVLNIESPTPNNFNESDERLVQGLADLAVIALQNTERYQKAEREAQRFELLYKAGQELGKITELTQLEQAYDFVIQIAEEYSQSQVIIRRFDPHTQELVVIRAARPQSFQPLKLNEGLNGQVARERRTLVIHDNDHPPEGVVRALVSDPAIHSFVVTPILFKERYYGNLGVNHKEIGHFRDADVHFIEGLAQQLASTIYRLETVQERQEFEQRANSAEEMSSIGQSAYEVTHRLGNDLGLVDFYITNICSELAKQSLTNSQVSENLDNIRQSVQSVLSFSRDLKNELAKLSEERALSEPVLITPQDLFEKVIAVSSLAPNIQAEMEIDVDVKSVRVIFGQVDDILRNLVVNATQAMLPEGGKITLRARNAGRSVALEVADTGVGISSERLPQIFDLFFSTKGSSGFGLWSARRIALKNQGDLKVESTLGQGTTFTLLLPGADRKIP